MKHDNKKTQLDTRKMLGEFDEYFKEEGENE